MDSYLPHSNLAGMDTPATPEDIARVKKAARKRIKELNDLADHLELMAFGERDRDAFVCDSAAKVLRQLAEGK